jgi:enoyl-CoA hydratase/carnithine racemase
VERFASLPFIVVAVAQGTISLAWHRLADVVVEEGDASLDDISANVIANPAACTALALLLRGEGVRTVAEGLVAESAVYSTLQGGPEFAAWRASRPFGIVADDEPRVRVQREGATLMVTMTRAAKLNALDARMRDELLDALEVAVMDPSVLDVQLRGEGRAFCAGGDLDEFGSRSDPATAHLIRLQRSVGRVINALRDRTTVYLHGPTMGSGIELAAFARAVVAQSDTVIALPEVTLGLIPGAGGTVSLPRRIGRLRTAWLALSARSVDAQTALAWGLVDRVEDPDDQPKAPASRN